MFETSQKSAKCDPLVINGFSGIKKEYCNNMKIAKLKILTFTVEMYFINITCVGKV